MSPPDILATLWAHQIALTLTPDGQNLTAPKDRLTPQQRALIMSNKPALVEFLIEARQTTAQLIEAAMRVCDRHGDAEPARQEMRDQCLELPPHLQIDLLDHFKGTT